MVCGTFRSAGHVIARRVAGGFGRGRGRQRARPERWPGPARLVSFPYYLYCESGGIDDSRAVVSRHGNRSHRIRK